MQGENLKIVHKSEKAHSDADTLSRYPVAGGENDVDEVNDNYLPICSIISTSEINANSLPDLQKAQQEDPIFGKLYQLIKSTGQNHKK